MYLVKFQQLFPEGDLIPWRYADGHLALFQARDDAEKFALDLSSQPKNRGYRYVVEVQSTAGQEDLDAAEVREFLV